MQELNFIQKFNFKCCDPWIKNVAKGGQIIGTTVSSVSKKKSYANEQEGKC